MCMRELWWLHCTSQWGWYTPTSERVYCVGVTFKMTELVEQGISTKFCIKLKHSSVETIQMIQKASAVGNWWLAVSSQQCPQSCITCHTELFSETLDHPGNSGPQQPRFCTLWLLAFSKTKIIFEREGISDHRWDSEKYDGAADDDWENCVRSQGDYFEGDWGIIVLCTMFLVLCIFFNKCLYFLILHGWILSWQILYS